MISVVGRRACVTYVVQGAVRGDTDGLLLNVGDVVEQSLLRDDGGDTASRQTSSAGANQGREAAHELTLGDRRVEGEEVSKEAGDGEELVRRVTAA